MTPLIALPGETAAFSWPRERHALMDFDGPVALFAIGGHIYVAVLVDEEGEVRRWLVAEVSPELAIQLVQGDAAVRKAFRLGDVHVVDQRDFDDVIGARRVRGEKLSDEYLPNEGAAFELTPESKRTLRARLEALLPVAQAGARVLHPDLGEGVVVAIAQDGYVRVFFSTGERLVPIKALARSESWADRVANGVSGEPERVRAAFLAQEAFALPLMESAAALTAAPIDLLPHQVVLTHRIATASPRRYLVADEVGLGKTIETALLLRELASRGELNRALMVVPAGLVNNWHREMNEVFRLDFEVFGSEGDVTDRKSNAFAKHDRLIASIDTLKRPARVKRLLEAPAWDLVVFDEAHHLTAFRNGKKITKTENYKLAEALKGHTRDLVLLSATPHQGDHFRFWMLIQLLNPTLFKSPEDMVDNRHRLNSVVFRRTKADACRPDGSPLFARRWVHTESFTMDKEERTFYAALKEYLEDGFALAQRQGNQGRALGFVMTIFQKIAASSFAAVRRTLRRRILMLTLHEAILKDQELDIDAREKLLEEARGLIHDEFELARDSVGRGQVEAVLADLRVKLLKKLNEEELELASNSSAGELVTAGSEDIAVMAVSLALPEERLRIRDLLGAFPEGRETKVENLLRGLGALWEQDPTEKIVIFATYLGTVDLLGREIEKAYPGQGVVVLRGGDHGAKLAAERRFKKADGPRVMVCTAAGREGINLQFARILFNFDLPWNPMDMEQRIGRIHRYGQKSTAQVYNLVLSDTIEGSIFLLLDEKLKEIAKALGKVDEHGNVAEDLRSQVLGQLSERLTYDKLYREALGDPELRRTKEELEAALSNASEARKVVFELFQDLDGFSLDDYQPFANVKPGLDRVLEFLRASLTVDGRRVEAQEDGTYLVKADDQKALARFTLDRDAARSQTGLDLLGLDHPLVQEAIKRWQAASPENIGVSVSGAEGPGVLTWWLVETRGPAGEHRANVFALGVSDDGKRNVRLERLGVGLFTRSSHPSGFGPATRKNLLHEKIEPMLERELQHKEFVPEGGSYSARLIGWVEVSAI
ncbi:MAG: DEAD/DEAH box helicase [Kofleriaceae bacterium]